MKPDPTQNVYPTDDSMMENFSEHYQLCQLIRDESFGWPLQDPDLDADPFNTPSHQALDFDLSVFDSTDRDGNMEWNQPWPSKSESNPIPESAWQQLAINLNSPTSKPRPSDCTSLTPCLAALDFPKAPSLPSDLDDTMPESRRHDDDFPECEYVQKRGEFFQNHQTLEESQQFPKQWEYQQGGDLGVVRMWYSNPQVLEISSRLAFIPELNARPKFAVFVKNGREGTLQNECCTVVANASLTAVLELGVVL